jgi:hypothetical protein
VTGKEKGTVACAFFGHSENNFIKILSHLNYNKSSAD